MLNSSTWPLTCYLTQKDKRFESWVANEIESLKQSLYERWIVFHDLNPTNILVVIDATSNGTRRIR